MVAEPRAGAVESESAPLVASLAEGVEAIVDERWRLVIGVMGWREIGRWWLG
jgi:hypothetical protein